MNGPESIGERLNQLLSEAGQPLLASDIAARFGIYLELLLRWNARTNLTAIRDAESILRRHFVESIVCARVIPAGVRSLLDLGSGAGLPGIPIALCRPEVAVTLAESQGKKAAFLREAARMLGLPFTVHGSRAETLGSSFDCVTLRAVDDMESAVRTAAGLVAPGGWLIPFTTTAEEESVRKAAAGSQRLFTWSDPIHLPRGSDRLILAGQLS